MSGYEVNYLDDSFHPFSNFFNELDNEVCSRHSFVFWFKDQALDQIKGAVCFSTDIKDRKDMSKEVVIATVMLDSKNLKKTFIKLTNLTNEIIDISGWRLADKGENTRVINDMSIEPGKSITLHNVSPLELNYDGNEIRLFSKQSEIVDRVTYISKMIRDDDSIDFLSDRVKTA